MVFGGVDSGKVVSEHNQREGNVVLGGVAVNAAKTAMTNIAMRKTSEKTHLATRAMGSGMVGFITRPSPL